MRSWERGFSEKGGKKKERDGNVIRTRRLIASPSSPALSPVLNRTHLDLFSPFLLIFTPSALISCVCTCAALMTRQWGNKADGLPDYSSLL